MELCRECAKARPTGVFDTRNLCCCVRLVQSASSSRRQQEAMLSALDALRTGHRLPIPPRVAIKAELKQQKTPEAPPETDREETTTAEEADALA